MNFAFQNVFVVLALSLTKTTGTLENYLINYFKNCFQSSEVFFLNCRVMGALVVIGQFFVQSGDLHF